MSAPLKLTNKEKLSFSATAMGKNLVYFLVATYYMFYLTQAQGLSGSIVGTFFAVTRIFDAINDPIMGTIVDNTRTRYGKFRPWILIGTITNTFVLILMFFPIQHTDIIFRYIFYLSLYLFWGITYTLMDVPYWSMIPAITTNAAEKNSVSSLTQIAAGIGMIFAIAVMPMVFTSFGTSVDPVAYLYPSIIIGVFFILLTILTVFVVKEKTIIKYQKIRFKEMLTLLFKNDQLLAYNIIMMCVLTASTIIMTFATYFFSFVLGDHTLKLFLVFFIIAGISQAGGMLSYPFIAKKINMNKIFYFAGFSSIFGLILFSLLTSTPMKDNIIMLSAIG
ncbi:MAG: glycoside-pentoside-hexuronide (GPH):cation symporter, partial [Bacillota bacterium]